MNRLDAMAHFVRVAELGSFAAAATQLGVARSVVTRQIAALESHLGVKLMERTTRRLTLTSAGQTYLERCRAILAEIDMAEAAVTEGRQQPRGQVRVGLPLSYGLKRLVPLLNAFARRYPEITLVMDFTDRHLNLIDEGFDVSIRITSRLEPGEVVRRLGDTRLLTVAAPEYLRRRGVPRHPLALREHDCLGYAPRLNGQGWTFRIDGEVRQVRLPLRMQASNGDALAAAAMAGLGVALQPDFIVADAIRQGHLQTVLEDFAPPPHGVYAVFPGNRFLPHRVRLLVDALQEGLSDKPAPVRWPETPAPPDNGGAATP